VNYSRLLHSLSKLQRSKGKIKGSFERVDAHINSATQFSSLLYDLIQFIFFTQLHNYVNFFILHFRIPSEQQQYCLFQDL